MSFASVRRSTVLALLTAGVVLLGGIAHAAELVAAEVDGESNRVVVEQGGSATFNVTLKATGTIRCSATPADPATVRLPAAYAIDEAGVVSSSGLTDAAPFYGSGSGTCSVTWPGDPMWQSLQVAVSADALTPLGDRIVRLRPVLTTPVGTGSMLRDDTPTFITISVVPGSDRIAPAVSCDGPNGSLGRNGWHLEPVRYDCAASDDGSGLSDPADAGFTLSTGTEGTTEIGPHTVADRAGNTATAGPYGPFSVDLHAPTVTVAEPAAGATYMLGASVIASYACEDTADGSGIESCTATDIETSAVGERTFRVRAFDNAGRETTVTSTYRVVYDLADLAQVGSARTHQAGSTVVIAWTLGGATDTGALDGAIVVPCDGGSAEAARVSNLRFEAGRFKLNWKTSKEWSGCRMLRLSLDDGTTHDLALTLR